MSSESSRLAQGFLRHLRDGGAAESTLAINETWLRRFLERYPDLSALTKAELTRYHQSLRWEPGPSGKLYSENTVNQALGVVRPFLRWCVKRGVLDADPSAHLKTRRPSPKVRESLPPTQMRRLLSLPDLSKPLGLRDRAVLGLICEVGATHAAVSRIDLCDIQCDTGALLLRERKRRIVSLPDGLLTDIERYIQHGRQGYAQPGEQALFVDQLGKRLSKASTTQIFRRYRTLAGLIPSS